MITTREALNYQFSLIFGYSSPKEYIVGNVIGPGKLTKKRVEELSREVINFLRMFNAMLRDYTGSEVFSIEFSLENRDHLFKKEFPIGIYPKSMIFIPGRYKDCESLLLALKPETGYLNMHSSRNALNKISELFYEVEEFTEHPELDEEGKEGVLNFFARRFSNKLYGDLLEDKWNKKLIGLNKSLPTEKEMLESFAKIKSEVQISWHKRPPEISISYPKYEKLNPKLSDKSLTEHLKYNISEPSAYFVIENSLKLGVNLMNLANTGTIDEIQDELVRLIIGRLKFMLKKREEPCEEREFLKLSTSIINEMKAYFNKFLDYSNEFLSSGVKGDLKSVLEAFGRVYEEKSKLGSNSYEEIANIMFQSIKLSMSHKNEIRSIELSSSINYFSELIKNSYKLIEENLITFIVRRKLVLLTEYLDQDLKLGFEKEQKPAKILGINIINKFDDFLKNQIETNFSVVSNHLKLENKDLIYDYKKMVNDNLEIFFQGIHISIGDLIGFAEAMMDKERELIKDHIEKFRKFSKELQFLLAYILRYSTVARFLKDEPEEEILDPVTFSNKFHRFLEKRIGGINLEWKDYILEWIKDYAKKFFDLQEQRKWTLKEIHDDFMDYLEKRFFKELNAENFLGILDTYIAKNAKDTNKEIFLNFFQQYELSIEIKTEFPKYVKEKITGRIESLEIEKKIIKPLDYLKIYQDGDFYSFIRETELKYFSKLVPRPISLILKHDLSDQEKESFKADLFHIFDFRYQGAESLNIFLSDNFKEVYREWLKEL